MGAVTIQTSIPTTTPGALGTGVAPYISKSKLEVSFDLPDTLSGSLRFALCRWSADATAWYPVQGAEINPGSDPSAFAGKLSKIFDVPSAGYYCVVQRTTAATVAGTTCYLTELDPAGAAVALKSFLFTNYPAANTSAVHAAVTEAAANAFPGPITNPPGVAGRNITATFAAGWGGGDITIVGTDQFGNAQTEVIADTAGSTVAGSKIFKTVTSISKETAAGTTDDVTIGYGTKIGVPFQFTTASFVIQTDAGPPAVLDSATLDTTNSGFTPATAANGTRDFLFIGG